MQFHLNYYKIRPIVMEIIMVKYNSIKKLISIIKMIKIFLNKISLHLYLNNILLITNNFNLDKVMIEVYYHRLKIMENITNCLLVL